MGSIEPKKFAGKEVILVDELFDNGLTMYQIKQAICEKALVDPERIFTCTLMKKNKSTKYPDPNLFGVTVPNIWLVGYGLDDKQEKRNWTSLYGCPKSDGVPKSEDDVIFGDEEAYQKMLSHF
jgi:hypoxanthine-guanine phosphoribosyltransferase